MRKQIKLLAIIALVCFLSCSCSKTHEICPGGEKPDSTIAKSVPFECEMEFFAKIKTFDFQQNVPYATQCFFLRDENNCFIIDDSKIKLFNLNELKITDSNVLTINNVESTAVLNDKNFWIISCENAPYNPELIRIDNSGKRIVSVFLDSEGEWDVTESTLAGTSDDGCVIAMMSKSTQKYQLNRFDKNGNVLWICELPQYGFPERAVQCSSGDFIISIEKYDDDLDIRSKLFKISSNGVLISEMELPASTGTIYEKDWSILGMVELPDSNLLLTVGSSTSMLALIKLDQNANIIWSIYYLNDVKVKVASENRLIACYNKQVNNFASNIALACINEDGTFAWEKTFGGTGNESVSDFLELPEMGFYIFGKTSNYNGEVKEYYDKDYDCYYFSAETIDSEYFIKTDNLGNICR